MIFLSHFSRGYPEKCVVPICNTVTCSWMSKLRFAVASQAKHIFHYKIIKQTYGIATIIYTLIKSILKMNFFKQMQGLKHPLIIL
jgi:hypothetical protein